jgi:hypothetical protein
MGLVVCPKHGNGFLFVCPHVGAAVSAGQPCHGIQYLVYTAADPDLAGIELAGWFCPRCIEDHHLPPTGTSIAESDDFLKTTAALYRPVCPGCFKDWQAQGHGDSTWQWRASPSNGCPEA